MSPNCRDRNSVNIQSPKPGQRATETSKDLVGRVIDMRWLPNPACRHGSTRLGRIYPWCLPSIGDCSSTTSASSIAWRTSPSDYYNWNRRMAERAGACWDTNAAAGSRRSRANSVGETAHKRCVAAHATVDTVIQGGTDRQTQSSCAAVEWGRTLIGRGTAQRTTSRSPRGRDGCLPGGQVQLLKQRANLLLHTSGGSGGWGRITAVRCLAPCR